MTFLKKLIVKGIRSYNPKKEQILEFCSPLTLIIGQNGTGKTTLIECLKYITTGTLPPNAKGGAFIYDGGLAKNLEVKAEIQLILNDFYNREIVIQKILQTTIKQKKTEQKILEHNVWVNNDNTENILHNSNIKSTISKINKDDLSSIFDINTSILENVVFCHQDDSMWYLSEPATIKKRFDDIFSSTRYSKTLDNLKKAKKEVSTKIKVINTELMYLVKTRDKKNEMEKKLSDINIEWKDKTSNIKMLEKNIVDCTEILNNLKIEQTKLTVIVNKKKELEKYKKLSDIKYTELECQTIISSISIEDLELKIGELEHKIENENKKIEVYEKQKEKHENLKKDLESENIKKTHLENIIKNLKINISDMTNWLDDQKRKFCLKLGLNCDDQSSNLQDKFNNFFKKYDEELKRKTEHLGAIKTKCDRLHWEIENNNLSIKNLEYLSDYVIDSKNVYDDKDIDRKITILENEYENALKLSKEMILNDEKIKKRDEILSLLRNKTKSTEIENVKNNTEQIIKIKQEIKKLNDTLNKYDVNLSIIKKNMKNYNSKIDCEQSTEKLKDLTGIRNSVYIDKETTDQISEISKKTKKCFLCDKKLDNCTNYLKKLESLGNDKVKREKEIYVNNMKIQKEINDVVKCFDSIDDKYALLNYKSNLPFTTYISDIENKIDTYKMLLEEMIGEKEATILDIEEENLELKKNINLFVEIENLNIKSYKCKNPDDIHEELKHLKMCREVSDNNKKFLEYSKLKNENLKIKNKLHKYEEDLKDKTEKTENLKTSIFKKKAEINYKLKDLKSKQCELDKIHNDIDNVNFTIKKLLQDDGNFDLNRFEDIKNQNLKNKDLLYTLKNDFTEKNKLLVEVNEHLEYYKNYHKHKNIEKEISILENKLQSKNVKNIFEYLDILNIKIETINKKYQDILEKKNILKGEINQLEGQIDSYKNELKGEYKDVVNEYNKKYIESKILDLTIVDIDKCISILDKSIIDYHYSKIEEININLKELWGNCYKGNDIDCIKLIINENGSKNYSYKMVIIKNNIELDMRNRSSAGQKMIGNILLRIALSKVFCCNFNILTLDEPTTNLDKENIESLAYTIIKIAKMNSNLQLVIITHDEDFLSIMCRENIEYYYRLIRNSNGDSVIVKEST